MGRLFYRKSTAAIMVAAILILVLLLCMLLVTLTQMSSLNARAEELAAKIKAANADITKREETLKEMEGNDWLIKWAEDHGLISEDDITWVPESSLQN